MNELIKRQQTTQETKKQAISSTHRSLETKNCNTKRARGSFEKPLDPEAQRNIRVHKQIIVVFQNNNI